MAVMSHARREYGDRPSHRTTDPNSLWANLRAVDERLRMACETLVVPAAASESVSQLVNF